MFFSAEKGEKGCFWDKMNFSIKHVIYYYMFSTEFFPDIAPKLFPGSP